MPAARKLGVAVIGSSGFAAGVCAPTLVRCADTELIGILGSTPSRGSQLVEALGCGRAYTTLDELLADDRVDAVWIAAPDVLHADYAIAVLEAGRHVLVEKPMATSVADATAIVEAARRNDGVLRVGTHQRFRRAYRDLKDVIDSGRLGELGLVRLQLHFPFAPERASGSRRGEREGSGGAWIVKELGAHLFDLALWWTGDSALVAGAVLQTRKFAIETDDCAAVLLRFGSGAAGLIDASGGLYGLSHSVEIHGTRGWLRGHDIWRGGGYTDVSDGDPASFGGTLVRTTYTASDLLDPYLAEVDDFVSAVAGGPSTGATGEAGLAAVRLIADALLLDAQR